MSHKKRKFVYIVLMLKNLMIKKSGRLGFVNKKGET